MEMETLNGYMTINPSRHWQLKSKMEGFSVTDWIMRAKFDSIYLDYGRTSCHFGKHHVDQRWALGPSLPQVGRGISGTSAHQRVELVATSRTAILNASSENPRLCVTDLSTSCDLAIHEHTQMSGLSESLAQASFTSGSSYQILPSDTITNSP